MRLTVANVVPADSLGEFSLEAQQGEVAAVFVPLVRLQQDLEIPGRVNTLLVSTGLSPPADAAGALRALVRRNAQLEDLGYSVETLEPTGVLSVGSAAGLLDEAHAKAATSALQGTGMQASALFTYLANSLRVGDREVPYSLVTALDLGGVPSSSSTLALAQQLGARTLGPGYSAPSGKLAAGVRLPAAYLRVVLGEAALALEHLLECREAVLPAVALQVPDCFQALLTILLPYRGEVLPERPVAVLVEPPSGRKVERRLGA